MGSMISLSVGRINIDYGQNENFQSHAHLFQLGDHGLNEYCYVNADGTPHIEIRDALIRPLSNVLPRLEMQGYTLSSCDTLLAKWIDNEDGDGPVASMGAFRHALRSIDWRGQNETHEYVDFSEVIREAYAKAPDITLHEGESPSMMAWERWLDPYVVLRVLADMPEYADLLVCWNYADVKDGGYVDSINFNPSPPSATWLLVTEGTSDTFVLSQSLKITHPDIQDFFDFIDMVAGNPFPGVGNIVHFCRGLSRINYTGQMLVVLDNDAAGRAALADIQALKMPSSFVATCLPDLEELRAIKTIGPSGTSIEDINFRASAIECFLDFSGIDKEPTVRWTSFMHKQSTYQGELVNKDAYVADFKTRFGKNGVDYDVSKLVKLWEHLITCCIAVSSCRLTR